MWVLRAPQRAFGPLADPATVLRCPTQVEANVSLMPVPGCGLDALSTAAGGAAPMRAACRSWRQALEVAPAALAPLVREACRCVHCCRPMRSMQSKAPLESIKCCCTDSHLCLSSSLL